MLEPLAVDPSRSVAPAANSIASARLVFPAPAGPTSAITRVPFADSPAMRLSFVRLPGAASRSEGARSALRETFTVRLFSAVGKGAVVLAGNPGGDASYSRMVDTKGHQAGSPAEMPAPAWKDIVKRTYKRVWDDNVGL